MICCKVIMARALMLVGLIASWMLVYAAEGGRLAAAHPAAPAVFDVTKYNVVADGQDDSDDYGLESLNAAAFIEAWKGACDSPGPAKVLVPQGKLMIARTLFSGPCKAPITFEIQGTLLANPDPSFYSSPEWFVFENVNDLTLTGPGIFDATGANHAGPPTCRTDDPTCVPGPTTIKFNNVSNGVIDGLQSNHAMGFHVFVATSHGVTVRNMHITSPPGLLNSDGVHVEASQAVSVLDNIIATGEDCVSIGNGAMNVTVAGITCESGYGISVGNLAKYELKVHDVVVNNCTLKGTLYGVRIKHWPEIQGSEITGITFENLVMDHVNHPILIDHLPAANPAAGAQALAKISDIHFKNIRGSAITKHLVNFVCSPLMPCDGIDVSDINLTVDLQAAAGNAVDPQAAAGNAVDAVAGATCSFAKVLFGGQHEGLTC